jgi:uncharacterized protein YciI
VTEDDSTMTPEALRGAPAGLSLYVVIMRRTARWDAAGDATNAVLREHLQWQRHLEREGVLVLAGPLDPSPTEPQTGLMIIRAGSQEEAERLVAGEPFQVAGLRDNEVRHWRVNEGCIRVTVRLSAGVGEFF